MPIKDEYKFPDEAENEATEAKNDDVEIEVVDDTPPKDRGRKPLDKAVAEPSDDELEAYSEGVKKRIKELTHARHDERRAKEQFAREKEELERATQALLEENRRLKQYVNTGEQAYAQTAKDAADSALEVAKRRYKDAYEAGDADAIVSAQEALTEAKMRAEEAKRFKVTPLQEDEPPVKKEPTPADASAPKLDAKTQAWMDRNRWFGDPEYADVSSFALGLHNKLVNSGVDPRSDEYFEQIDARLRSKFPEVFEDEDTAEPPREEKPKAGKKPPSVVAPATRSSGPKKIQLTASQVAIAKRLNLTPQQYAMEVAKLERRNG